MRQALHHLSIETAGRSLVDITAPILRWVAAEAMEAALLTIFCRHTSASLLIQENADPAVQQDMLAYFAEIAPEAPGRYLHDEEGPDDMPAHLRAALTQTSLSIPVEHAQPVLGTWQGIYLFEHRRAPHRREIVLHIIGA